jgi:hypothetical protein
MWEVHYSHEAGVYLEDNGQLIAALFFAMESLATVDGIPTNNFSQDIEGFFYWLVEAHTVVYRRLESKKVVRILYIKPD